MGLGVSVGGKQVPNALKRFATSLATSPEEAYVPLRKTPELFSSLLRDEWLAPTLMEVVAAAREGKMHPGLKKEAEGIYSFELFTPKFCRALLDEVDNYFETGLPVRRPNSMNNYGLIVNEIGMKPTITELQQSVLLPIAKLLWPKIGAAFHSHHSFMVQYRSTEDAGLDLHTDDSDVTFNVCLGEEFTGAGLTFCGYMGAHDHRHFSYAYQHEKGRAVVHLGSRRHGADDIQTGTRRNLIIWNHNMQHRQSREYAMRMYDYQQESGPPDKRCLSFTHDRDYPLYKDYPPGTEDNSKRAWCPPPAACYDTMSDDIRNSRTRGPVKKKT
ncbi:hypothetical protein CTAYLR_006501 [Chrysophaeum taylorii]|uniref:Fe2OG dioxygenase domain-containing protein n=1 Tax=Chrysophaeum taylorii TaxID=2483200 RepID=A0AAD7UMV0_9STRA|nr:hypothetical protein CTAYLR_006501 [Chrysophaeum taylorii]